MAYDFKKLLAVSKRRVPDEPVGLYLYSLEFARVLLPKADSAQGLAVGKELQGVALFYFRVCLEQARKARLKKGRPQNKADAAFVYAMARLWESLWGPPKFRKYRQPRKGEIGGKEAPTGFQRVCNAWMEIVDPDRPGPLTAAAFKGASKHLRRHPKH